MALLLRAGFTLEVMSAACQQPPVTLEMLRSGKMRTGANNVDDTPESIAHLISADAEYEGALRILLNSVDGGVERLTRQPSEPGAGREVRWYHLWRQTPKYCPPERDDWSVPGELSPEAALAYFEKHEGFTDGLEICDDGLAAEFVLKKHELIRTPRGNSVGLRAGPLIDEYPVKRRQSGIARQATDATTTHPFRTIVLNPAAPGSGRGLHELRSLGSAIDYISHYVSNKRRAELHWLVAIAALNNARAAGVGFSHARAALVEALASEGWLAR
jgi:hypothetical protein